MLLNVGCGAVAHPAWLNLDLAPQHPLAVACDLRAGLPVGSASCDATYSSHVLEHLCAAQAVPFLDEQYRVLKPGGIMRVVVPDLEQLCRLYLQHLEALKQGELDREFGYRFALLEIFDQVVRDRSGGELLAQYLAASPQEAAYILERHGDEARRHMPGAVGSHMETPRVVRGARPPFAQRVAGRLARYRAKAAALAARVVGGADAAKALAIGRFRLSGEVHRVMYDRWGLEQLLLQRGFQQVQVVSATESRIAGFADFELDAAGGQVRKPDSLFVEAMKPRS